MKPTTRLLTVLLAPALLAWTAFAAVPVFAMRGKRRYCRTQGCPGAGGWQRDMTGNGSGGARLQVTLNGLTSAAVGEHGIHIHALGMCEAPAFTTAGGHFNPGGKKHGLNSPEGHHAGDMHASC
jgi:hypothetical protein